jgi:hypothetical protein
LGRSSTRGDSAYTSTAAGVPSRPSQLQLRIASVALKTVVVGRSGRGHGF